MKPDLQVQMDLPLERPYTLGTKVRIDGGYIGVIVAIWPQPATGEIHLDLVDLARLVPLE